MISINFGGRKVLYGLVCMASLRDEVQGSLSLGKVGLVLGDRHRFVRCPVIFGIGGDSGLCVCCEEIVILL